MRLFVIFTVCYHHVIAVSPDNKQSLVQVINSLSFSKRLTVMRSMVADLWINLVSKLAAFKE